MPEAYESFRNKFYQDNCKRCDLSAGRTNLVLDRGNPQSSILVVGEAPGADEDLSGKCFVGRAGKKLDEVMAEVGLDTNRDMLIVNVVKCRPPKNRPPTREEAETCSTHLKKQIQIFDPKMMVLLGRTALKYFFPENSKVPMQEKAGHFFELPMPDLKRSVRGILLYHPAYLLYDPRKRPVMIEHLRSLREALSREKIL